MSITLTETAAKHVIGSLEKRGKGVGIRLGVKTAGCSGLAYKMEFVDEIPETDVLFNDRCKSFCRPKKFSLFGWDPLRFR